MERLAGLADKGKQLGFYVDFIDGEVWEPSQRIEEGDARAAVTAVRQAVEFGGLMTDLMLSTLADGSVPPVMSDFMSAMVRAAQAGGDVAEAAVLGEIAKADQVLGLLREVPMGQLIDELKAATRETG